MNDILNFHSPILGANLMVSCIFNIFDNIRTLLTVESELYHINTASRCAPCITIITQTHYD